MKRESNKERKIEMPVTSQKEMMISEIPQQLKELVNEEVLTADGEIGAQLSGIERRYQDCINSASLENVEELKKLEKTTAPLRLKVNSLRNIFKKVVPFLLPLVLTAKIEHADMQTMETSFDDRAVAAKQLRTNGITDDQKSAYIPGVSDILYRGILPAGYPSAWELMKEVPKNLINDRDNVTIKRKIYGEETTFIIRKKDSHEREDAWRLYLGIPQENDTFGISEYRPANSKKDKYYYRINNWFENFSKTLPNSKEANFSPIKEIVRQCKLKKELKPLEQHKSALYNDLFTVRREMTKKSDEFAIKHDIKSKYEWTPELIDQRNKEEDNDKHVQELKTREKAILLEINQINQQIENLDKPIAVEVLGDGFIITTDSREKSKDGDFDNYGVMGQFKISLGEDEKGSYFSYYDVWNLEGSSVEGEEGLLGKPFEIYDRIYYNPDTHEVVKT